MLKTQRCCSRKERTVPSQCRTEEGERRPWRSPVYTCSWYGFARATSWSMRREVWVKKTFSSLSPCTTRRRFNLGRRWSEIIEESPPDDPPSPPKISMQKLVVYCMATVASKSACWGFHSSLSIKMMSLCKISHWRSLWLHSKVIDCPERVLYT